MRAIILTAHGSRREESNQEFISLVSSIAQSSQDSHAFVTHAFLELSPPFLKDVINSVIKQGADHIEVFPYFLNKGVHVEKDIPAIIQSIHDQHSNISITQLPYLGSFSDMSSLIRSQIKL